MEMLKTWLDLQFQERERAYGESYAVVIKEIIKEDNAKKHNTSGWYYGYRVDEVYYAASLIKVPLMAVAFYLAHKGRFDLREEVTLTRSDQVQGSGVLQYLSPGLKLSIYDLIVLMIVVSDNTATNLLIERMEKSVGKNEIQSVMQTLGFEKTRFYHSLMIIDSEKDAPKNVVTASEMSAFLEKLARGEIVSWDASRRMIEIMKQQTIQSGLPSRLPLPSGLIGSTPSWSLAHKTGSISGMEHDVGLFYVWGKCTQTKQRPSGISVASTFERTPHDDANSALASTFEQMTYNDAYSALPNTFSSTAYSTSDHSTDSIRVYAISFLSNRLRNRHAAHTLMGEMMKRLFELS